MTKSIYIRISIILLICLGADIDCYASDTLKVKLYEADSIFLSENYYLLASSMDIKAQQAQILAAKLYPNPVFTADLNAYDPENKKIAHVGATGQKTFQIEQLILLGGKRRTEIEMAKTNAEIAELEFQNLVRELKFKLHKNLFSLGQIQTLLVKYSTQLSFLDTIMNGYEIQVAKGNMPLRDLVRLKSVYLNLNNDRAELLKEYFEAQSDIQILLQFNGIIEFKYTDKDIARYIKSNNIHELTTEALSNHPALLIMQENEQLAQQYLQLQKRSAIPDINLFSSYDQRGGAFSNQINAGVSIALPLWNRNKGNIKTARALQTKSKYNLEARRVEILSTIQNNYALYTHTVEEYKKASLLYSDDFDITLKGMSDNFQKRNISMIEFVDFFESYNLALAELARIKTQLVTSAEELNMSIGKDIY